MSNISRRDATKNLKLPLYDLNISEHYLRLYLDTKVSVMFTVFPHVLFHISKIQRFLTYHNLKGA